MRLKCVNLSRGLSLLKSLRKSWREMSTDVSIYFYVFKTGRNRYCLKQNVPDICGPISPGICFILVVCQMSLWRSMSRGSRGSSRIISNRNNRFPKRFQNGENQYFGFIGRRWESLVVILEIKSSTVRFHLTNKPFYRSQPLFTAVNPRSILWKSFWAPFLSLWSSSPTWIWDFVDLSPFEAIQGPLFCIVWFQGGQKWPHWPKDFK